MAINFAATLDNKNIISAVREAQAAMGKLSQAVEGVGESVDEATSSIKEMIKQAAALGGISLGMAGVKEFLSQMISVRKEMQGFQISLETLLGDKDKASTMFSELKNFAATTPLMLNSLASGAQTMLGFDIAAERIIPTLKQIGDISMGDSNKFNSLVLAFSQMSATGKLMGQDLLQMINAGFNPLTEISRKTGKSISELKDEMSEGAISAEMVADAFASATEEGGKFYGMLEKQGEGLAGQLNTLSGALDDMYNEIAEGSEGAISTAIGGVTTLIQNYDKIGKIIATTAATYGTYKAALVASVAVERIQVLGLKDAIRYTYLNITATKAATVAQQMWNWAVKANPYVMAATAIIAIVGAIWTFASNAEKAASAQDKINRSLDTFNEKQANEKDKFEELIQVIKSETSTLKQREDAYRSMSTLSADLSSKYTLEQLSVMSLADAYSALAESQEEARMKNLEQDTKEKVNVYNNLLRIHQGKQKYGDYETQQFIQRNNLQGMESEELLKILREQITKQMEELQNYENAKKTKAAKGSMSYAETAKTILADFQDAKAYWEKIQNTGTIEEVKRAKALMDRYDKEYEELTGKKASSLNGNKSTKDSVKDAKKLRELQEKQAKDAVRDAKDQILETEQARIDAMKEGSDKVLAQIDLDYAKEREAIKREEEDLRAEREKNARELWEAQNASLVAKNADAWKTSGAQAKWRNEYSLSQEDLDYFEAKTQAAEAALETKTAEQTRKDQEAMDEFLIRYGNYFQQREAIQRKYNRQIEDSQTEGARKLAESEMAMALEELDQKFDKSGSKIYSMWKDVAKKSRKEIKTMISELKKVQEVIKDGKISENEKTMLQSLGFTDTDIEKLQSGELKLSDVQDRLNDLAKQLEESSTAAQNFWDALRNTDGSIDIEKVATSFNNMLSKINAYSQGLSKMANLLSNGSVKDAMEDVQTVIDEIGTGASIGASAGGGWGALIGAIIGTVSGVGNVIKDHINDNQIKTIARLGRQINILERAYKHLGDAVEGTYSVEKQQNINAQIVNLQKQNLMISEQIRQERAKKDSSEDTINSYEDAIKDNLDQIKKLKEEAKDAIFGEDLQSAIDNFANAYAEAWTNNENRTRKAKDVVRDMMKQMVTESIKSTIEASSAMENIRKKMTEYFKDGILSEAEQQAIYAEAEKLQNQLDKQFSWADDLYDSSQDFSSSTSGGFQTMSQESADELNGRFTTSQITIEGILQQSMLIYAANQQMVTVTTEGNEVLKEIKNIMITMGSNVEDIASYTKALTTFGEKFDEMNRHLAKL